VINTSFSVLFNLLGAVLIALIIYVVYKDASGASIALFSAALCLFVANIDRYRVFQSQFGLPQINVPTPA
jgi:hypothetical protein